MKSPVRCLAPAQFGRWAPTLWVALTMFVLVTQPGYVDAQVQKSLKPTVTTSPREIAEWRGMLHSEDPDKRLSAMATLLASPSLALRELAFGEGFASDDAQLRSMALIGRLSDSKVLSFDLVNSRNLPASEWVKVIEQCGSDKINYNGMNVDAKTGQIDFQGTAKGGRVAGHTLTLVSPAYQLTAKLGDGAKLTGTVSCGGKPSVGVSAQLQ